MAGIRKYLTFVLRYHPDYDNIAFVLGRISGINYIIYNDGNESNICYTEIGAIIESYCTDGEYEVFKSIIEEDYPGLCIFDWEE